MSESVETLIERARLAVAHSGLAQREVARGIGLDETKLSKSLRGQRRFAPAELNELATVTGVTVNWLLSGSDTASGTAQVPAPAVMLARAEEPRDQAQRRRIIAEKAWRLFAERGVEAVRIADIAAAAGLSPASVHYYYAGKNEIFDEALRYSVKLAFDRQIAQLDDGERALSRLSHLLRLQTPEHPTVRAEWSIWVQTWARAAVRPDQRGPHDHAYDRWQQTVESVVQECIAEGVFAPEPPAAELATELTSLVDGLGIKVLSGRMDAAQMTAQLERYLGRLLAAPHPAGSPPTSSPHR